MADSGRKVFIDGHVGTTGLRIRDWLAGRDDLELVDIEEGRRKNDEARRECLLAADLAVLCLPDDASRQAAGWVADGETKLIDASTAFRVDEDWVYGIPELGADQREAIRNTRFVSNPGCYPSAVVLALRPLVDAGLLTPDCPIAVHALSGYSGGGRKLIEKWQDPTGGLVALPYEAPYSLQARHKHMPEMTRYSGLTHEPLFVPAVGPFECGMRVEIPLHASIRPEGASGKALHEALVERYANETFVKVRPLLEGRPTDDFSLDPRACNDTNRLELQVIDHESDHVLLVAILDNLGKGASGAAIQSLNLMLGLPEAAGLPE